MNDLYDAAIAADREGRLTDWIVDYLHQSGHNIVLAKDLLRQGKFHTGFVDYPIDKLDKLLGPDRSFDYYEEPGKFEHRVTAMVESLRNGWRPVPLIASRIWSKDFELNDGAHRAEALRRTGALTYPTVFYFENEQALADFYDSHSVTKT